MQVSWPRRDDPPKKSRRGREINIPANKLSVLTNIEDMARRRGKIVNKSNRRTRFRKRNKHKINTSIVKMPTLLMSYTPSYKKT